MLIRQSGWIRPCVDVRESGSMASRWRALGSRRYWCGLLYGGDGDGDWWVSSDFFICRELFEVDVGQIGRLSVFAGDFHRVRQVLLDLLVNGGEVKRAAFLKRDFELDEAVMRGNPPAGNGLQNGIPYVRTEKGSGDMSVLEVQDWDRKGLEARGWLGGEIYKLKILSD